MKRITQIKRASNHKDHYQVPPGQFVSKKFPVFTYGHSPNIDLDNWRLRVFGEVDNEKEFTWDEFMGLPQNSLNGDFHCVTHWSAMNNTWEGVLGRDFLCIAKPTTAASYVMVHCYGGYTTNIPLEAVVNDAILARSHNGEPLNLDHGWPLRLVVPTRYGWKSAKWVCALEFMSENKPGFWEMRGYNDNADPWKEERFWDDFS